MIVVFQDGHYLANMFTSCNKDKIIISKNTTKWWKTVLETLRKRFIWKTMFPQQKLTQTRNSSSIDEINRGEISKILANSFSLIDPAIVVKRMCFYPICKSGTKLMKSFISLKMSIIGTMNDIDRSVDTFDFSCAVASACWSYCRESSYMLDKELNIHAEEENRLRNPWILIENVQELNSHYHIDQVISCWRM